MEFVASGSRFRVFIPRETCILTFLLGGINCVRSSRSMPSGEVINTDKLIKNISFKRIFLKKRVSTRFDTYFQTNYLFFISYEFLASF